jgi:GNAT superfamily N-acetyltransferase
MQIKSLNPAESASDFAAALPAFRALRREIRPGLPEVGETWLRFFSHTAPQGWSAVLGAFDEGRSEALGLAFCGGQLEENRDLASLILEVPAEGRHQGVDVALFEAAAKRCADEGCTRLAVSLYEAFDPTTFAEKFSGRLVSTTLLPALDLNEIDRAEYESWAAPSEKNAGYSLVRWIDHCPDDLAESFCRAMDAMHDQPMGEMDYAWVENDVRRLRIDEEFTRRHDVRRHVLAALDADGRVAGYNSFTTVPDEPEIAEIWDTGVVRAHRGHGLGLRIKAAATLWLLETHPSARWVKTANNATNQWMMNVNRKLGYRVMATRRGYEFPIGGFSAGST